MYAVFRHNDNIRHCLSWFNLHIENLYIENPPKIYFDGIFSENKGIYFGGVLCSSFSCSLFSSIMSFRKGLVLWAKLKKRKSTYTVISSDILKTSWFKSRSKVVHIHLTVKCSFTVTAMKSNAEHNQGTVCWLKWLRVQKVWNVQTGVVCVLKDKIRLSISSIRKAWTPTYLLFSSISWRSVPLLWHPSAAHIAWPWALQTTHLLMSSAFEGQELTASVSWYDRKSTDRILYSDSEKCAKIIRTYILLYSIRFGSVRVH